MRPAKQADKELVVELIARAYQVNPSVLWIVKQDHKIQRRIRHLANYLFDYGMYNKGLFLTDNNQGLCLIYDLEKVKTGYKALLSEIRLAFFGVTLPRIPNVLKRQKKVGKIRGNVPGIYALLFAVDPDHHSLSTAMEIQRFVYEKADREQKNIYAETSVPKNKQVYERFGFITYDSWEVPDKQLTTWFMKREPGAYRKTAGKK